MLYIYKYGDNPQKKDPFTDPWIRSPGKNDYHAIRCDNEPKKELPGIYNCKGWSYVGSNQPKQIGDKPNPLAQPESIADADAYWKNGVPADAYCCCKPIK